MSRSSTRRPASSSSDTSSGGAMPVSETSASTMFVSIASGRRLTPGIAASPEPRARARRWSSATRSSIVSSATRPAAAAMPARWTLAPPRRCSIVRARPTTASLPASTAPNGAERLLLRDITTEFAGAARSASGTPSAAAAFTRRAPSTWTRQSCRLAAAASASVSSADSVVPPARVCVFSRTSRAARRSRIVSSTASGSIRPSAAQTAAGSSRATSTIPIASDVRTWEAASSTTRSPGSQNVSSATRFAIPHVGTHTAAGLPSSSATRSQSSFTEASSPTVAQPSSALRIASHISLVGTEQRSERRSITSGAGAGPAARRCARRRRRRRSR